MENQKQLFILQFIVFSLFINPILIEAATQLQINTVNNKEHINANKTSFLKSIKDSTVSLIGEWTLGVSYSVYVANNIAYFTKEGYLEESPHYLEIVDISDPANPTELGNIAINTATIIKDIVVKEGFAYLAVDSAGLRIINVADPKNPYEIGFFDTDGSASGVAVSGDYAYVADGSAGLRIINISDPSNPIETAIFATDVSARGVDISDNHVFVVLKSGMIVLNVSDPNNPKEIGSSNRSGYMIQIKGNYAYMPAGAGMYILDITNPANPKEIAYYRTYDYGNVKNVSVSGNYAYLAHDYSGLYIVDISNPTKPKEISSYDRSSSYYNDVAVIGGYAYVALSDIGLSGNTRFGGLKIVDISDPSNPTIFGLFPTSVNFDNVAINGDYAYIADGYGLRIFNFTNPAKVIQTGFYNMRGADKVVVAGNFAYVLAYNFYIFDISDPSKPTLVSSFKHNDLANDLYINGTFAYVVYSIVSEANTGLKILDISDPTNPVQTGFSTTYDLDNIDGKGDYVYTLNSATAWLHIIDVSNPSNPVVKSKLDMKGQTNDITVVGDYAYVANRLDGLRIINISDPSNPIEVGFYDTDNLAFGVSVSGGLAYVADGSCGLLVIDITKPSDPTKIGFLDIDGDWHNFYANDVLSDENHAYIAYGGYGFCIVGKDQQVGIEDISLSDIRNFNLEQNFPNPFHTITTINYSLQTKGKVKLSVFDITGREIKTLVNKKQTGGAYSVLFDGSGLDSGIYTYELKVDSYAQRRKMLFLR